MKQEKFNEFWNIYATQWLNAKPKNFANDVSFGDLCDIKKNANNIVYLNYSKIKEIVKKLYFNEPAEKHVLNRYKRAAVLIQAILLSQPLSNKTNLQFWSQYLFDERFAYYMGISSILMDYDEQAIKALNGDLFNYELADRDVDEGNDTLLISIYKDLHFSTINDNYNVLTMANVLGLIFSRISKMGINGVKFIKDNSNNADK